MKLIYEGTNREAKIGDVVKYNDRYYHLEDIIFPQGRKDRGKVVLKPIEKYRKDYKATFFPENIGAEFINE